jgi:hypothetical protein
MKHVVKAIKNTNFNTFSPAGQAYIEMSDKCNDLVSSGVGKRTMNPDDYVVRVHREKVGLFLNRKFASKVDEVAIVVYTKEAYLNDPDISEQEMERIKPYTHILVAVLASCGIHSPLTPGRFTRNLAGGNREALLWSADEIRQKAKVIAEYSNDWCVIAD